MPLSGRNNGVVGSSSAVNTPSVDEQCPSDCASPPSPQTTATVQPLTPQTSEIITLKSASEDQLTLAAKCFGRSMIDDPTMTWVTKGGCPDRLVHFFYNVARMSIKATPDRSTCWALRSANAQETAGAQKAAAAAAAPWSPQVVCIAYEYPRTLPSDWAWMRAGLIRAMISSPNFRAARVFGKLIKSFDAAKARFHQEHGPFLYIVCFGTDPDFQGKGLGSELMREALAHARELGVPAYLEASGLDSCRFYQRNGFEVLQEFRVEPDAPAMYFMANFLQPEKNKGKGAVAC